MTRIEFKRLPLSTPFFYVFQQNSFKHRSRSRFNFNNLALLILAKFEFQSFPHFTKKESLNEYGAESKKISEFSKKKKTHRSILEPLQPARFNKTSSRIKARDQRAKQEIGAGLISNKFICGAHKRVTICRVGRQVSRQKESVFVFFLHLITRALLLSSCCAPCFLAKQLFSRLTMRHAGYAMSRHVRAQPNVCACIPLCNKTTECLVTQVFPKKETGAPRLLRLLFNDRRRSKIG